jgi:hypothetical protein
MRDLQQYWQDIRTATAALPPYVWMMSLDDPKRGMRGGCMVEVAAETAAKLLYTASHRRASVDEIEAYQAAEAAAHRAAFHERLRVKGVTVVPVSR